MSKLDKALPACDESTSARLMEEVISLRRSLSQLAEKQMRRPKQSNSASRCLPKIEFTISSLER
jgi:hypothetical protein